MVLPEAPESKKCNKVVQLSSCMKINEKTIYTFHFPELERKTFISMKNLLLSQIDLDIQEVDLKEVRGGSEKVFSGSGKDGRTGCIVKEYIIIDEDHFFSIYEPIDCP